MLEGTCAMLVSSSPAEIHTVGVAASMWHYDCSVLLMKLVLPWQCQESYEIF